MKTSWAYAGLLFLMGAVSACGADTPAQPAETSATPEFDQSVETATPPAVAADDQQPQAATPVAEASGRSKTLSVPVPTDLYGFVIGMNQDEVQRHAEGLGFVRTDNGKDKSAESFVDYKDATQTSVQEKARDVWRLTYKKGIESFVFTFWEKRDLTAAELIYVTYSRADPALDADAKLKAANEALYAEFVEKYPIIDRSGIRFNSAADRLQTGSDEWTRCGRRIVDVECGFVLNISVPQYVGSYIQVAMGNSSNVTFVQWDPAEMTTQAAAPTQPPNASRNKANGSDAGFTSAYSVSLKEAQWADAVQCNRVYRSLEQRQDDYFASADPSQNAMSNDAIRAARTAVTALDDAMKSLRGQAEWAAARNEIPLRKLVFSEITQRVSRCDSAFGFSVADWLPSERPTVSRPSLTLAGVDPSRTACERLPELTDAFIGEIEFVRQERIRTSQPDFVSDRLTKPEAARFYRTLIERRNDCRLDSVNVPSSFSSMFVRQ